MPVPAQVLEKAKQTFGVEFTPRIPGEHRISVLLKGTSVPGVKLFVFGLKCTKYAM